MCNTDVPKPDPQGIGKDGTVVYKNTKVIPANDAKQITEFITKAEQR